MITYEDKKYRYRVAFKPSSGLYIRTSVLDKNQQQTNKEAFRGSYPHLLDIGIMGHCKHGLSGLCKKSGVQCYQSGDHIQSPHMSLNQFKSIIDESQGRTFQIALGGRGDPNHHPDFIEMIKYASVHKIVPNFTTSGYDFDHGLLPDIKKYCGAVAVSYYRSDYTMKVIKMLLSYGIKTNIHFVLGNNSIDEAIDLIENKKIISGINRMIFLLHKPVGLGQTKNVLSIDNPKVKKFYQLFNQEENCLMAGFDTCTAPALIHFSKEIAASSYDTCEAGRFSAYISPDMKLLPCSFDRYEHYAVSLEDKSISEAFNSDIFDAYRRLFITNHNDEGEKIKGISNVCQKCQEQSRCMGGCPLMKEIVLCHDFQTSTSEMEVSYEN